jgi:hypothetical protein
MGRTEDGSQKSEVCDALGAMLRYGPALKAILTSIVLALALLPALVLAREAREQQRIDFLIQSVESSKGITFVRNGSEHDGGAAAAHLRMKLNYLGERVKTAEDFVKSCASESSLTHRKYSIRRADGTTMDSAAFFAGLLREFDRQKRAPAHE